MSWNPRHNSVDLSRIAANVFGYLETNQQAALERIAPGAAPEKFKKFYTSAAGRVGGVYPALMLISKEKAVDYSSDVLKIGVQLTFEGQIQHGKPDVLAIQSDIYAQAVEEMLANIPPDFLLDGVLSALDSMNTTVETGFAALRGNNAKKPTAFLQGFQTQITYLLMGENY